MIWKRIYRAWLCWKYGLCRFHGTFRPRGGYGEGRWGRCATCADENRVKENRQIERNGLARLDAQKKLDRLYRVPRKEFEA